MILLATPGSHYYLQRLAKSLTLGSTNASSRDANSLDSKETKIKADSISESIFDELTSETTVSLAL